jgi:hypothetical protein
VNPFPLVPLGHAPDISVGALKELVRARDDYACFICRMTQEEHVAAFGVSLHVHRMFPGRRYTIAGCVTLCQPCHGPQPRSPRHSVTSPAETGLTIRLGSDEDAALRRMAESEDRTITAVVMRALKAYAQANNHSWPASFAPPP